MTAQAHRQVGRRMRVRIGRSFAALASAVALLWPAGAQAAQQGQSAFVPASQLASPETIAGGTLLYAAYAFAWVAILAYVFALWRKASRLEREMTELATQVTAQTRGR